MLVVKLIKKLKALTAKLKAVAVKRKSRQLVLVAEDIDYQHELAEKRMIVAAQIKEALELRACDKLLTGTTKANEAKALAGKQLDELNAL